MQICRTFGCLPSQALAEDTDIIQLLKIDALVNPREGGEQEW